MTSSFVPPHTAPAPAHAPWSPRMWGLLVVLAGNMLIDALEVSVALVALPAIGTDLGAPLTTMQWTITGFAVGFGGLMLFGARVVALLGRRRVYLAALLGFAAASLIGALAEDPSLLIATRVVKGFCAALTAPTGLAIIATAFPEGPPRNRALSVYTLFGAGGFTTGLLLSGWLTGFSWRLTFAFPAPAVLVLFVLGLRLIPGAEEDRAERPPSTARRRYGIPSAASFLVGLLALVQGITSVPAHGWADVRSTGPLALAGVLLTLFVALERASAQPLVRFEALRSGAMVRSALGAACLNGSYLGLLFILSHQLQSLAGWSPLRAAAAFLPAAAPLVVTALFSGRIVARFGAPRLIAAGALLPFAGYLLLLRTPWPPTYATGILPTMLLVGAGFVLAFAALNSQATSQLSPTERGAGSGLYQTAVQVGAAVSVALVAALLTGFAPAAGAAPAEIAQACRPALTLVAAVGGLGLFTALTGLRSRRTGTP
ncbi:MULTISPECIES: MFS transporter [unclassified Streptomyces]|uniref:MFS transporter n=1 Tax=unclassified Streptomyces TaxID=2593676 RepID=UPI00225B5F8A|nr:MULTISPECIES: MFS transporter [unclassified Streptomyces]WSP58538.1 MFS transporter [Streptomyces sp. NBC_01241]WSU20884.1 MFS transporter [Streptomyces sp. NBC_01108]MCX4790307.1 MFS transporter [Streptomyces sp. NBC_01221]MCX4793965.1 MFS transporter [Streptomyces sp. NBC_01242]WSJ35379.1 MFS transporter [Streptomyces sp. NBC_01321]